MNLRENLLHTEERILHACARSGRKREDVTLVAVTKTHPVEIVREAYDLGLRDFGENRVQEMLSKTESLPSDIRWHLIGLLQSNKAKYIAPFVHMVHSIESVSTARELSKRAEQHARTIEILIEVNVSGEESKSGIAPIHLPSFLVELQTAAPALKVKGLMTVAPYEENPERTRPVFARLRELAAAHSLPHLSMGMTNDFEVAIEEGATLIRVGSALFGERA
ncbi:MAG: YggS family pyridoxal phosphate-dependent enzyme [Bacteroidetes bacterium]|nr:YggS family pyridoxal phosphate-dependent enzyme [Bacteroidota bacterium]